MRKATVSTPRTKTCPWGPRFVAKGSITAFNCNTATNGFQPETEYLTGAGGEQLSELGADGNGKMIPQRSYVYQGGAR